MDIKRFIPVIFAFVFTVMSYSQTLNHTRWKHNLEIGLGNLSDMDKSSIAVEYLLKAKDYADLIFKRDDSQYIRTLRLLALAQTYLGRVRDAADSYKELVEIHEISNTEDDEDYIEFVLRPLANLYKDIGDFIKAKNLLKQAYEFYDTEYQKSLEQNSRFEVVEIKSSFCDVILNLVDVIGSNESYYEAIKLTNQVLDEYSFYDNQRIKLYVKLGFLNEQIWNLSDAENYYDKALELVKKRSMDYIDIKQNIAWIKYWNEDYESAIEILNHLLLWREEIQGEKDINSVNHLLLLTEIYENELNNQDKALLIYDKALKIVAETSWGKISEKYLDILFNKAELLQIMDKDEDFRIVLDEINNLNDKFRKEDISVYALNLGRIIELNQKPELAINNQKIFKEARQILKTSYGKKSDTYSGFMNSMALIDELAKRYEDAILKFEESREITKNLNGINNLSYLIISTNVAKSLLESGQTLESLEEFDQILAIISDSEHEFDEQKLEIHSYLGQYHFEKGEYTKSVNYLESCQRLSENLFGENSLETIGYRLEKLKIQYLLDDLDNLYENIYSINRTIIGHINNVLNFSGQASQKSFLSQMQKIFYWFMSLSHDKKLENFETLNSKNHLFLKTQLLRKNINILTHLSSLENDSINEKILKYKSLKNLVSKETTKHAISKSGEILNLKNDIDEIESELIKYSYSKIENHQSYSNNIGLSSTDFKENSIGIEFSHFNYFSIANDSLTDKYFYYAYIFKPGMKSPEAIHLFEEKQLANLIFNAENPTELYGGSIGVSLDLKNHHGYQKEIYDLIWKPLESYLKDINTIYYSPDGLLNQIAFSALAGDDERELFEKYNLVGLSSVAKVKHGFSEPAKHSTLAIGDVTYDYDISNKEKKDIGFSLFPKGVIDSEIKNNNPGGWEKLLGTEFELNGLSKIYTKHNLKFDTLTGSNATEQNFKKIDGNSPDILHIATHGYYFENFTKQFGGQKLFDFSKSVYRVSDDPLIRSGLILAGGNYAWLHGTNPYEDDDGILTSLEISNMDLSNTHLVVLSACSTGLGDIESSEGVYGLQRAFKIAGVDLIMMTLWEINDRVASEFIQTFYTEWFEGLEIREAFKKTQSYMKKKYPQNPDKWAAFVLFD